MNEKLETEVRQQLRASEDELDAATLAKLREARQRALEAVDEKPASNWSQGWVPLAAAASVVMLAVLVAITMRTPGEVEPDINMVDNVEPVDAGPVTDQQLEDFEAAIILAAETEDLLKPSVDEAGADADDGEDLLDLYENLEFYEWLAIEDAEEAAS